MIRYVFSLPYRVTNEHAWGKEGWDDFTPPLDDIDGAARVLQPVRPALTIGRSSFSSPFTLFVCLFVHQIFDGVARRNFMSGLFLKDYTATSW